MLQELAQKSARHCTAAMAAPHCCCCMQTCALPACRRSVLVVLLANVLLGLLVACWSAATRLEAVRGAAVTSRAVKFLLKFLLLAGLVTLLAFMIRPQQVRLSAACAACICTARRGCGTSASQPASAHTSPLALLPICRTTQNHSPPHQRWLARVVLRLSYVEVELARLVGQLLLAFLPHYVPARRLVNSMAWVADLALGLLLLLLLFIGSLFGLLTRYQAAVLFSMGYAASYLAERGLEGSELGRLARELQELRRERCAAAAGCECGSSVVVLLAAAASTAVCPGMLGDRPDWPCPAA